MSSTKLLYLLGLLTVALPELGSGRRLGYVMDDTSIRTAVTAWLDENPAVYAAAYADYGHISTWDTGGVTDMSYLFNGRSDFEQFKKGAREFNEDISAWQTSGVTDMTKMFTYAYAFDQPIGSWNVGLVTSMQGMFYNAQSFNQSLNGWDVANVENMATMFAATLVFNQPLGDWNVGAVTKANGMFNGASAFNQALDSWDLSAASNIGYMFIFANSFDQDLGWCVDNNVQLGKAFCGTACESTACGVVQGACTTATLAPTGVVARSQRRFAGFDVGECEPAPSPAPAAGALGSDGARKTTIYYLSAATLLFLVAF